MIWIKFLEQNTDITTYWFWIALRYDCTLDYVSLTRAIGDCVTYIGWCLKCLYSLPMVINTLMLETEYSGFGTNIMPADALAPRVARASAGMVLAV